MGLSLNKQNQESAQLNWGWIRYNLKRRDYNSLQTPGSVPKTANGEQRSSEINFLTRWYENPEPVCGLTIPGYSRNTADSMEEDLLLLILR